jgi:hypothetical protein
MTSPDARLIPLLHAGVVLIRNTAAAELQVQIQGTAAETPVVRLGPGQILLDQIPQTDLTLEVLCDGQPISGSPLQVQVSDWTGAVDWVQGRLVSGRARNLRKLSEDVVVLAYNSAGQMGFATARAAEGGRFVMVLPEAMLSPDQSHSITLGIAGSDYVLQNGQLAAQTAFGLTGPQLQPQPRHNPASLPLAIRIKISTPNLKEAPQWGDYHFANSLSASFERLGCQAAVDTNDVWYAYPTQEDVVITLRGRHRLRVDPGKINIMWLISHPDRIPDDEYADFDHIAVASDIYAAVLRARGLTHVSVLHQATDAGLFCEDPTIARKPSCLFVGNSRREYRTMVRWCVESDLPFDLYGGGWDGILPAEMVRAPSIANRDLARFYASHLLLLNDHWDSMRDNGFLSNRLFDGSAVGTPILTDPVEGLADVFGDSISVAATIEDFAEVARDCLANPAPYLERAARARDIVLGAHTFDHRARQLADLIDRLSARKYRGR